MPTYILLLTLTPEGRARMAADMESMLRAESDIAKDGVSVLGLYGVLGEYDFVSIVDATDNETVARFSLELGVAAGAHIATLPAIPVSRLDDKPSRLDALVELDIPPVLTPLRDAVDPLRPEQE